MKKIHVLITMLMLFAAKPAMAQTEYIRNLGNLASDPGGTCVNTRHYYNTVTNKIRCCELGTWSDCGSTVITLTSAYIPYGCIGGTGLCSEAAFSYNYSADTMNLVNGVLSGTLSVEGNTTFGNATTDITQVAGKLGVGIASPGAKVDITQETINSNVPMLKMSTTWDDSGTSFVGLQSDITGTNAAATSRTLQVRYGSVTPSDYLYQTVDGKLYNKSDLLPVNDASFTVTPTRTLVATNSYIKAGNAIVIGADGLAVIASQNGSGDIATRKCATADCSVMGSFNSTGVSILSNGTYSNMDGMLGGDDQPMYLVVTSTDTVMVFIHCVDAACSAFDSTTITGMTGALAYPRIALYDNGDVAISYMRQNDGHSYYKLCTDPTSATPCVSANSFSQVDISGAPIVDQQMETILDLPEWITQEGSGLYSHVCTDNTCSSVTSTSLGALLGGKAFGRIDASAEFPDDTMGIVIKASASGNEGMLYARCGTSACVGLTQSALSNYCGFTSGNSAGGGLTVGVGGVPVIQCDLQNLNGSFDTRAVKCSSASCASITTFTITDDSGGYGGNLNATQATALPSGDLLALVYASSNNNVVEYEPIENPVATGANLGSSDHRWSDIHAIGTFTLDGPMKSIGTPLVLFSSFTGGLIDNQIYDGIKLGDHTGFVVNAISFRIKTAGSGGTSNVTIDVNDGTNDCEATFACDHANGSVRLVPSGACTFPAGASVKLEILDSGGGDPSDCTIQPEIPGNMQVIGYVN